MSSQGRRKQLQMWGFFIVIIIFHHCSLLFFLFQGRPDQVLPITLLKQIMCLIILIVWSQCTDRAPYASVDLTSLVVVAWVFWSIIFLIPCVWSNAQSLCQPSSVDIWERCHSGFYTCMGNLLHWPFWFDDLYIEAKVSLCSWRHLKLSLAATFSF